MGWQTHQSLLSISPLSFRQLLDHFAADAYRPLSADSPPHGTLDRLARAFVALRGTNGLAGPGPARRIVSRPGSTAADPVGLPAVAGAVLEAAQPLQC